VGYYIFFINHTNTKKKIAKVEDCDETIPKVDTIISEPIGVLLFHERMVTHHGKGEDLFITRILIYIEMCLCLVGKLYLRKRPLFKTRWYTFSFYGCDSFGTVHRYSVMERNHF
jgi:hypothetical protein